MSVDATPCKTATWTAVGLGGVGKSALEAFTVSVARTNRIGGDKVVLDDGFMSRCGPVKPIPGVGFL